MAGKMGTGALPPKGTEWTIGKTDGAIDSVNRIVSDMTGRGGGDEFWHSIDEETKGEIKGKWATLIMEAHGMAPVFQVKATIGRFAKGDTIYVKASTLEEARKVLRKYVGPPMEMEWMELNGPMALPVGEKAFE